MVIYPHGICFHFRIHYGAFRRTDDTMVPDLASDLSRSPSPDVHLTFCRSQVVTQLSLIPKLVSVKRSIRKVEYLLPPTKTAPLPPGQVFYGDNLQVDALPEARIFIRGTRSAYQTRQEFAPRTIG
jgi:hypothetical protein